MAGVRWRVVRVGPDAQAVAHDVGLLLFVPAGMAAVTVPVAFAVGEPTSAAPVAVAAVGCAGAGVGAGPPVRGSPRAAPVAGHRGDRARVAVVRVGGGWGVVGVGVAAPAGTADAVFASPVDALFEAMSGITSTGLSVADGVESELSRTVQWWRSVLQWVGGLGVVLFAAGFGHTAAQVSQLYGAEGRSDDFGGDVRHTVRAIMALYAILTVVAIGAFALTEQTPWVALTTR